MNNDPAIVRGIWHSVYSYESSGRVGTFTDERDMLVAVLAGHTSASSLEERFGSLRLDLQAAGRLIAATWTERTDPDGYYAGAEFQGVAQFILAEDGLSMSGAWAGHSRDMTTVNTGPWTFTYVGPWPGDLQGVPDLP